MLNASINKLTFMFKPVDNLLDSITMYRLMLYYLLALVGLSVVFSLFRLLPFNPLAIIVSTAVLVTTCMLANKLFSYLFKAPANVESFYITALILTLIITPTYSITQLPFLVEAAILAISSKYILAINKKHIFNPAALAAAMMGFLGMGAGWWIGTTTMALPILIGGMLIVRKLGRSDLILSFLLLFFLTFSIFNFSSNLGSVLPKLLLESPILFFTFVMLTEPQTTPPFRKYRVLYGGLVGVLSLFYAMELALLAGNLFSYIVGPKWKLILQFKGKRAVAKDTYDFIFEADKKIDYQAGQYMEWTLQHNGADSRGNRRYFTLASSPTEGEITLGTKFYPNPSSFKKALLSLQAGEKVAASQLAGEFTLPKDSNKGLVFLAGGIGITPFRSMVKYLLDTNQKRDTVLFYSNKGIKDIAYKDIFDEVEKRLGIKVVYVLSDTNTAPKNWPGKIGLIDERMIKNEVKDFKDRTYYISGPHSMVDAYRKTLTKMSIPESQIRADFFPGYA